jgi:hypothetical protein
MSDREPTSQYVAPRYSVRRIPPSAAVVARPLLVLLPVLTFLVPGCVLAFTQPATYTSETRLIVAGFDVQAAAVPAFVEASRNLAETYGRLVDTELVIGPVAEKLNLPRGEVAGHISGSPIPESAIIRIEGSSDDPDRAEELSAAAADALAEFTSGTGGADDAELLKAYEAAARDRAAATNVRDRTQAAAEATPSAENQAALATAEAALAAASLRADRAADRFNAASGGGSQLQRVGPALEATSNRRSRVQLTIAGSVLLGLVAGVALATVAVNRSGNR